MNPEIQEKIFNEVVSIFGNDPSTPCTYNHLQEMKYLEMAIKESLRLHPSVPVIGRRTLETIQIQGVDIPPGIDINIPIYAMHRNPDIFPGKKLAGLFHFLETPLKQQLLLRA